jgi:hypothetical protein
MGCRCARRTIRLPHGNKGGGAGDPGSSHILCFVSVLNGLEWVVVVQDELSACLMVTGEEVLETLCPIIYVCICVERIGMGCRFAGRTIRLPHGNLGGGAGDPGSSRLLCSVFVLNVLQD